MLVSVRKSPRRMPCHTLLAGLFVLLAPIPAFADYEVALELYRAGEYEKAAEEILVSLELAPDYAYGRALLGSCKLRLREYDEAAEAFARAARVEPDQPRHRMMLAQALYLADRGTEALEAMDALPESWLADPEIAAESARWRGLALARLQRCPEAIPHLVRAGADQRSVATTLERCARRPEAAAAMGQAIASWRGENALDGPTARALALAHVSAADYEQDEGARKAAYLEALRWIQDESSLLDQDPELLMLLGRARLGAGDLAGAARALEDAVAAPSPPCPAWISLAEARARLERWSPALEAARHAVACQPDRARAHVILAAAYNGLSLPDDAEKAARSALEIGESTEARRQLAMAEAIREHQARIEAQEEADAEARRRWKAITGKE